MSDLVRSYAPGDRDAVERMRRQAFGDNRFLGDFEWRHIDVPTGTVLWVAEIGESTVGFMGYITRPLRLGRHLVVRSLSGGDGVVDETVRGQGIGKRMMFEGRDLTLAKPNPAIVGVVWAGRRLASGLYGPSFGYQPIPATAISYTKLLSWDFLPIDTWDPPPMATSFVLEVDDLPPLGVWIGERGVSYSIDPDPRPAVTARLDPRILALAGMARGARAFGLWRGIRSGWLVPRPFFKGWWTLVRNQRTIRTAIRPITRILTT